MFKRTFILKNEEEVLSDTPGGPKQGFPMEKFLVVSLKSTFKFMQL